MEAHADYLFEISWEVCNKVGGINTVIKTKADYVKQHYDDHYFVVGPYFPQKLSGEFIEKAPLDFLKPVFENLKKEGIVCHYGRWLIKGEPNTMLVDFSGFTYKKNDIKADFWNSYKIDSLNSEYFSYDEPMIWGYAVGKLLELISKNLSNKKIVAQFHEWLAGGALLYLKKNKVKIATVFTTHATMLGRVTASYKNIYAELEKMDPEKECYNFKVNDKHQTERTCANVCEVFTTVSEITGIEAEHILKRKPDVILPNGLNLDKFPTFEEASIKHHLLKGKIKEFIMYYFFPYYTFDLDNTLIYFICGRYEFHDKGIDIFIKALSRLNERLKKEKSEKTIVAFFWIPGNVKAIRPELLESKTFYEDVKDDVGDSLEDIKERIVYSLVSGAKITGNSILHPDFLYDIKTKVMKLKRKGKPELSTHYLQDEDKDLILSSFRKYNLLNNVDDRVKVIFYPIYLTGADGLLDTNSYEGMQGSHLGVFPSFYEPWGYTPLEAAAMCVSSVTTDLAGFGRYVEKKCEKQKHPGVFVLKRMGVDDEEAAKNLGNIFYSFAQLSREDRIKNKIAAKRLSAMADWKILINNYVDAHNLAVTKMFG